MDKRAPRLAIPVLRSRVAPVFNWCSKMQIFFEDTPDLKPCQEIVVPNVNGFDRLRLLHHENVHTLICGALSRDLVDYGGMLGLVIIDGISGEVCEVLKAYHAKQLNQPRFRLPGCPGQPKKRKARAGNKIAIGSAGPQMIPGRSDRRENDFEIQAGMLQGCSKRKIRGAAEQGYCVCPQCGTVVPCVPAIPCSKMACAKCGLELLQVDSLG